MKEYLDVVDMNGNPTGETVLREKAHREGIWHRTSHVWLARVRNGEYEILLQKRCLDKDSFPGCFDISSAGHIPAGVEYIPSALRELEEELGIKADEKDLICCGDRTIVFDDVFHGVPFHDRQYSRVFLMWNDMDEEEFIFQKEEIESLLWMDFDRCKKAVVNEDEGFCIYMEELDMIEKEIRKDDTWNI